MTQCVTSRAGSARLGRQQQQQLQQQRQQRRQQHLSSGLGRHAFRPTGRRGFSQVLASATAPNDSPGVPYARSEDGEDAEWCAPTFVTVDNSEHKDLTIFNVDSPDYPGLLRVLAWAMNGMELRVQNAKLNVTDDGFANNKFYVTNYDGKKLKDKYAKLCAQRLSDFAFYCHGEHKESVSKSEYRSGLITVSNTEHDKFSRLTIEGEPDRQGFLLEVCSVISGLGLSAKSGSIQSCANCGTDADIPEYTSGRMFEIYLTNKQNNKLTSEEANGLLFVLGMLLDPTSHGPTTAPNFT